MTDPAAAVKARLEEAERIFAGLREPFQAVDLQWRVMYSKGPQNEGQGPLILVTPYVNRPALINRLSQVCGLDGWQTDARVSGGHVYVGVGVRIAGEWVWRWDGTGPLDHDPKGKGLTLAEAGKGNFSNAFKRACEQLGCALYLRELKPLRAIINQNGRHKAKVDGQTYRWDPPGMGGTPSYPGEIPGYDVSEGGEHSSPSRSRSSSGNGPAEPENPPKAVPPKQPTEEEAAAEIKAMRLKLSNWMKEQRFRMYHLEAVLATHPKLKMRVGTPDELGRIGSLEDWKLLMDTTEGRAPRWDEAPKELAKEFPTTPDRLQALDELMDSVEITSEERILISSAIKAGWNDAIEFWIEDLGQRT